MRRALLLAVVIGGLAAGAVLASAVVDEPSRSYQDALVIEAPRNAIWALLTEFEHYDDWNPYIADATGRAKEGSNVELTFQIEGEDTDTKSAEILVVHPQRKLEWRTRTLAPGLLDHEQVFRVLPLDRPGRFRVVQEARVEGLLAPFADFDAERAGLVAMLSAIAENASSQSSSP